MNVQVKNIVNNGTLGKLLLVLNKSLDIDIKNLDNLRFYYSSGGDNLYDCVLEQNNDVKYTTTMDAYSNTRYVNIVRSSNFLNDSNLPGLKKIANKIKFNNNLIEKIDSKIDEKTLGVHIRLTDMNNLHSYNRVEFDDYRKKIDHIMEDGMYDNIFVASDNEESIEKLDKLYNITYNNLNNRNLKEVDLNNQYNKFLKQQSGTSELWIDSYLEMLSLSKCGGILKNVSSLSTCSIIFSSSIEKIYMVK